MKLQIITTSMNECEDNTEPKFIISCTPEQAALILEELPETPGYDSVNILRNLLTHALELYPAQPV